MYERPEAPLAEIFINSNIAISIEAAHHMISDMPGKPWVGEHYAYQVPAYYYAIRSIARKRDLVITPEDVIREAMI
ncbi:hypothetical protein ATG_09420 [Desulfurococcaceae archaeon AG1]|jgi:hypothetical protein|nr:MAG: hypothetical protein DJ555_03380 [Desulfurococcaceae archaeon]GAY25739.1 hypothetical protein ATG_09420 [Desulfurococcaceae archaeon AG1]